MKYTISLSKQYHGKILGAVSEPSVFSYNAIHHILGIPPYRDQISDPIMDKKILLGLLLGSTLLITLAIFIPSGKAPETNPQFPWIISEDSNGNNTVFGITINKTTLGAAQKSLKAEGKINLFATPNNTYSVEAYFRRISLSGLKADLILSLAIEPDETKALYERGARQKALETGNKQIDLASEDYFTMKNQVIDHITYIPAANLDAELIESRFGQPTSKITEAGGITHWLYPEKGLDIALNPDGKEVFQYVSPHAFNLITKPLAKE